MYFILPFHRSYIKLHITYGEKGKHENKKKHLGFGNMRYQQCPQVARDQTTIGL